MVLILKIILDCTSRILIFSSWLYVSNDGNFCTMKTFAAFYIVFGILVVFNVVVNSMDGCKNLLSITFWIGDYTHLIFFLLFSLWLFLGIILNSFSSVLSYNSFDIQKLVGKKSYEKHLHRSTFFKQILYFFIFICLYLM